MDMQIQTASFAEFTAIVEWAAQEGWNPGNNDARMYYDADPNGFFVGKIGDEIVAAISAVRYDPDYGFMGFYIVRPDMRGKGCGIAIWNHAVAFLEGCNIGLDGVVEQQANYAKSGFRLAYNNIRFEGTAKTYTSPKLDVAIQSVNSATIADVLDYEREFFPADRSAFVRNWFLQEPSVSLVARKDGAICGIGVARPCRIGYKIGPLYSDSMDIANMLWCELNGRIETGQPVFLDVPDCNAAAMQLVEKYGLAKVFETARMYTGEPWKLPVQRMFSVTSFEIG